MSDNVFADLELPNPEERLLKANLVLAIRDMVAASKLTQAQMAAKANLTQPTVSRLLSGMTKDISVEKLLYVITALGHNINIFIDEQTQPTDAKAAGQGYVRVSSSFSPVRTTTSV